MYILDFRSVVGTLAALVIMATLCDIVRRFMKKTVKDQPSPDSVDVISIKYINGATNPTYGVQEDTKSHVPIEMTKIHQMVSVPTCPTVSGNGVIPNGAHVSIIGSDIPIKNGTSIQDISPYAATNGTSLKYQSQLELVDRTIVDDSDVDGKSKKSKVLKGKRSLHSLSLTVNTMG